MGIKLTIVDDVWQCVVVEPYSVMEVASNLDPQVVAVLEKLEKRIGYTFTDKGLLLSALTHASGAEHRLASNERLEFLGDAILGAVVCEMLYRQYPDYSEGDLTKIKSIVVSRQTCTKISQVLGMQEFLILGKGMTTHPTIPPSLLANVFESLVAAIYLDGSLEAAKVFILTYVGAEIELAAGGESGYNYKSLLRQMAQREHGATPTYQLLDEKGPEHKRIFKIGVLFNNKMLGIGIAPSKKEAEEEAAKKAFENLHLL